MSEVYLYQGSVPLVQTSLACTLHRLARVNDSCDAGLSGEILYLATASRLYSISLDPVQVTSAATLSTCAARKLWVCSDSVWVADNSGNLAAFSPPNFNFISFVLPQAVVSIFSVESLIHALLQDGEVRVLRENVWGLPQPSPWLDSLRMTPVRQVLSACARLVLVTDSEVRLLSGENCIRYAMHAQIVHAAFSAADGQRVRVLLQDKTGQMLQDLSIVEEQWVAGRAEKVSGVSLVKLLNAQYVLEYSNAGLCVARMSHNESVSRLKGLIAAGKYREAEPVLEALGQAALPLIRSLFEKTCKVHEVTALLKLVKLLPSETLVGLCEDLIANPPTDVDCAINLFSGALKLITEVSSQPDLEPLRTRLIALIHKAETFRLVSAAVSEHFPDFLASNLLEEIRELLTKGRMREGLCLLRRHLNVVQQEVVALLNYLPEKFSLAPLVEWLRNELVPMLTDEQLGQLEAWVEQRARGLADLDVKLAYELATVVSSSRSCSLIAGASLFAVVQQHRQLADLTLLQTQLKALLTLRTTYDLAMSFNEFLRVSPEDIAEMMLQRIQTKEQLPQHMEHFRLYVQAQGWKCDAILLNFFLKNPPVPESVLLALLQEVHEDESRERATECLLEHASFPLSAQMRKLSLLCSHKPHTTQGMFAELFEAAQQLQLGSLNLNCRVGLLKLLTFLAIKPEYNSLSARLAEMLELGPESVFERQVIHHINEGTTSKLAIPNELSEAKKRDVLRGCMYYALSFLRPQGRIPPQMRKLSASQVECYYRGLEAVEFLGQALLRYFDDSFLTKQDLKTLEFLRRLARDYKIFLTFEEWKSRELTEEVLAAIAAVQKTNPLKRSHTESSVPNKKRVKVQKAHLNSLLAAERQIVLKQGDASGVQALTIDLLRELAQHPTAARVLDLTFALSNSLFNASSFPALLHLQVCAGLVKHVAHSMGLLGKALKLEMKEYFVSSGHFIFCHEAVSTVSKDFAVLAQTVAEALRSDSMQEVAVWCTRQNAAIALLPLNAVLPKVFMEQVVEDLLWDVLRGTHMDAAQALSLLLCLPRAKSFELLSMAANNSANSFESSKNITGVAVAFASLTRASELRTQWMLRDANITWQHRMTEYDIPFSPAIFSQHPDTARLIHLIPALLAKSQNYNEVLDFCHSYSLPEIEAVGAFVEQQLLIPKVRSGLLPYLNDSAESLAAHLTKSPFESDYKDFVQAVLCNQPKEGVKQIMMKVLSRVPQVDYERVLFIFSLLLDTGLCPQMTRQKQVVELLLDYRRAVMPSATEMIAIRESQRYYPPELANLCEAMYLVKVPLDFIFTKGKETLAREVTIRTVEQLVPVGSLIRCDADFLRFSAVKNDLLSHQHSEHDTPCPTCPSLAGFKAAIVKLRNFADKYELAVSVVQHFPVSEESVGAANFCRVTAGLWLETLQSGTEEHAKVQGFVHESEKRARGATLLFELKQYGLLEEFAHLVNSPSDLVAQLIYTLAPRTNSETTLSQEELWSIVTALAKRSELHLDELMEQLVHEWIAVPSPLEACAYSLTRTQDGGDTESRLLFLANQWDVPAVVTALLKFVEAEKGSGVTLRQKTEALGLLLKICPKADLEQLLPRSKFQGLSVTEYYQLSFYLVDFEELRIPYSIDKLMECNKGRLVRAFLLSNSKSPRAVQLAVSLVCDFSVEEPDVISELIGLLVKQDDFTRLCTFLHTLALRGVLARLSETVLDTLVLCVNHLKNITFEKQQETLAGQVEAFAAIIERLDPPSDKLAVFIRLLLDGFLPRGLMEHLIPACVRLILLVSDPTTLQDLSHAFAERFVLTYPLLVVSAVSAYVSDVQHPLLREVFFKVEEEGSYEPLLQVPTLMTQICSFLVKNGHCKRLMKLAKHKLGRSALTDISNGKSQDVVIREVVTRLQQL